MLNEILKILLKSPADRNISECGKVLKYWTSGLVDQELRYALQVDKIFNG